MFSDLLFFRRLFLGPHEVTERLGPSRDGIRGLWCGRRCCRRRRRLVVVTVVAAAVVVVGVTANMCYAYAY